MRLGQIKHILNTVTNDNYHLELKSEEPIADGGYYSILNLSSIKLAIEVLAENKLIKPINKNSEKAIYTIYNTPVFRDGTALMTAQEYNTTKNCLAAINAELPNIITIINKLVQDQPEDIINIMIPADVDSFEALEETRKRIVAVLKTFKITEKDIQVVGFDTGSKWYQIKIKNKKSIVTTLIAAIGLIVQVLDYANSLKNNAEISIQVETMNINIKEETGKNGTITEDDYIKNLVKKEISRIVKELMERLTDEQLDGDSREAYTNMVEKGVFKLFEEREKGLIFAPSLNPPEFLNSDENMNYSINYEKLQELNKPKNEEKKELNTGDKIQDTD